MNTIQNASIVNSQNCRYILHCYDDQHQPHTPTLDAFINESLKHPALPTAIHDTLRSSIRSFWGIRDITLKASEHETIHLAESRCSFYNVHLDKNSFLKLFVPGNQDQIHAQSAIHITVWNDLIINKHAQIQLIGPHHQHCEIYLHCYGMCINAHRIRSKYSLTTTAKFDAIDLVVLRNCFSNKPDKIKRAAKLMIDNMHNPTLREKVGKCSPLTPRCFGILKEMRFVRVLADTPDLSHLTDLCLDFIVYDAAIIVENEKFGNRVLEYIINSVDEVSMSKWQISYKFWLVLQKFCRSVEYEMENYLAKILKLLSILIQHYNEQILKNVFVCYSILATFNDKHNIYDLDLVLNGHQFVENYNRKRDELLITGYTRDVIGNKAIPVQIEALILLFHPIFDITLKTDICQRLVQLFDFKYVGVDAVRCIARVFDADYKYNRCQRQIHCLLQKGILSQLFRCLHFKLTEEIVSDQKDQSISILLHILSELLRHCPEEKAKQCIQRDNVVVIMHDFIMKLNDVTNTLDAIASINNKNTHNVGKEEATFSCWDSLSVCCGDEDGDISMANNNGFFVPFGQSQGTHDHGKHHTKCTDGTKISTSSSCTDYVGLQFNLTYLLFVLSKFCKTEEYLSNVAQWLRWAECTENVSETQRSRLLNSAAVTGKLYEMAKCAEPGVQFYASHLLIRHGAESNEQLRFERESICCRNSERFLYSEMSPPLNSDVCFCPVLNCMDVWTEWCLSDDVSLLHEALTNIRHFLSLSSSRFQSNEARSKLCGRLSNIVQDAEYDMLIRSKTCLVLLVCSSRLTARENPIKSVVIRFLIRLLSDSLCGVEITKINNDFMSHEVFIHITYDGDYVGLIDMDVVKLIACFGEHFESPYDTMEFAQFMHAISTWNIWPLPAIWETFVEQKFLSKLEQCCNSDSDENIKRISCIAFVNFLNEINIMSVNDIVWMALKPSIYVLSTNNRFHQQIALNAISCIVGGQPANIDVILEHDILSHLITIILQNINGSEENRVLLQKATNLLLELSNPTVDQRFLPQLMDGLNLTANLNEHCTLDTLCGTLAVLTDANYIQINKSVYEYIIETTKQYHRYDVLLVNGYLREQCLQHANVDAIPVDISQCCMYYGRIYGNILQLLIDSVEVSYKASSAILNLIQLGIEHKKDDIMQIMMDHNCCTKLIEFIDNKPLFRLNNATFILSKMTQYPSISEHLVIKMIASLKVLLLSSSSDILENVMSTFGNIANLNEKYRDLLLSQHVLNYLFSMFQHNSEMSLSQDTCTALSWVLTNICNQSKFDEKHLVPILKMIHVCLTKLKYDTLEDICLVYADLVDRFDVDILMRHHKLVEKYNETQNVLLINGYFRTVDDDIHIIPDDVVAETLRFDKLFDLKMKGNPMTDMIKLLTFQSNDVKNVALKVVANIVERGAEGTQFLISRNLLASLKRILNGYDVNLKQQTLSICSKICAGATTQIQCILDTNMFPLFVKEITKERKSDYQSAKHAFHAICSSIMNGTRSQIFALVRLNIMLPIFKFVNRIQAEKDVKTTETALKSVQKIIASIDKPLAIFLINRVNGVAVLRSLIAKPEYTPIGQTILDVLLFCDRH